MNTKQKKEKSKDFTIKRLRHNILFENFSDRQFAQVFQSLRERRFKAGDIILRENSESNGLFLLAEGRVKIIRRMKNGEERMLALLHAGDFFGEMELIDGRSRSADVIALDDCVTFNMAKKDFERLLEKNILFAKRLVEVLSIRLRALNYHFIAELERPALQLSSEYEKLKRLIDSVKVLNSTLNLDELLKLILETALKGVNGDRGTVYLIDEAKKELWSKDFAGPEPIKIRLPIGKGIAGYVAATGDSLNIHDAYLDPRFNPEIDKRTGYRTKTILCMPMKDKNGKTIGVFQLLNKRNGAFSEEDEQFISALSVHAALAIENARLYEEEQMKIQMEKEMIAAGEVQKSLFPKQIPRIPRYDCAARNIPARQVSGDLYDFFVIDENRIAICLGDVSGKGLPASLLMANLQATLRDQPFMELTASECIRHANKLLYNSTTADKFVTLFYGILDINKDVFRYVNAGHDFPYYLGNGDKLIRLNTEGIPLGVLEEFPYGEKYLELKIGDTLLIYSDGICEAMNGQNVPFGEERLETLFVKHREKPINDLIEIIMNEVKQFTGNLPQMDDMTLVVLKRIE